MSLVMSHHAKERLLKRVGAMELSPALAVKLEQAAAAGATGVISGGWLYVLKGLVLVTVRPRPQHGKHLQKGRPIPRRSERRFEAG